VSGVARCQVHVVTGPLGAGKTTAIRAALRQRPAGERWAVLVNEFGEIGVDGAVLEAEGGIAVRQIAGGCVCCVAGPQLRVALTRLLREERPTRLFIEPSGLASPASILDLLRSEGVREAVDVGVTVALIDPERWAAGRYDDDDAVLSQLDCADVVVAHKVDRASPAALEAFEARVAALWPPKLAAWRAAHGGLGDAWWAVPAQVASGWRFAAPSSGHADPVEGRGAVWPPEVVFDRRSAEAALRGALAAEGGVLRLKGVLRTTGGWRLAQSDGEQLTVEPSAHRRDSRVEVLASATSVGAVWAQLKRDLDLARRGER
jgi:G3E family GTPase